MSFYLLLLFFAAPLLLCTLVLSFWFWIPISFFALIALVVLFFIKVRRQRMVLVLIQSALETNTPIHEVLDAYAATCWGAWYREKVYRFSDHLRGGHSVSDATAACRGVFRYDAAGLIRLGGGSKQVRALLRQTVDDTRRSGRIQLQSLLQFVWLCSYLPLMTALPIFFMFWIMPKFEAIFNDFDVTLPAVTIWVTGTLQYFAEYAFLLVLPLCALMMLPFVYFIVRSGFFPWRPPGARWMLRNIDAAYFLRILATGLELKKNIPEIAAAYAFVAPSQYLRTVAQDFSSRVERGQGWIAALTGLYWLTRGESALLDAAVRVENVPEMLREIAAGKEQRQMTSDSAVGRLFFLLFVLGIGTLVLLLAMASFMPLVKLINSLVLW